MKIIIEIHDDWESIDIELQQTDHLTNTQLEALQVHLIEATYTILEEAAAEDRPHGR